jgi:chloramphenicol O-acetyltransferase type A
MSRSTLLMQPVDFDSWPRKQHFELFQHFSQPYFNVCIRLNTQALYTYCKAHQLSFFQAYVYATLKACHAYDPIMLRIIEAKPWLLNTTRASVVELADDDSFRFSYFDNQSSFSDFSVHADSISRRAKSQPFYSNAFLQTEGQADLIHISVLPWLNFSAFSHAFAQGQSLGIPKFVFGQYDKKTGTMPFAIDVHHSLMDGLHVAKFINMLQATFDNFCKG